MGVEFHSVARYFIVAAALLASGSPLPAQDIGHQIADALRSGNTQAAEKLIADALRSSPRDARLWTLNGIAQAQSGDKTTALTSFRRALQYSPSYVPALESAARIEYENRDPAAVTHLQQLEKLRPADPDPRRMLAAIDFDRGDCAGARDQLTFDPAAAQREYGACLVKRKQFANAASVFDHAANENPDDPGAAHDAALADFLARRYHAVIARLAPKAESLDANALDILGETYAASGRPGAAVKVLARAIVLDPSDPARYVHFADACLPAKQFNAALETLNAGIQTHPGTASLYVTRGVVLAELARYEEADADFRRAQYLDADAAAGAIGLAQLQHADPAQTEAAVTQSLRQHPNNAMLHYVLAETIVRSGAAAGSPQFQRALESAQKAIAEDPNLSAAHDVLARLYLQSGNTEAAIRESRAGLNLNPHDPTAIYHLLLALRKGGQMSEIPSLIRRLAEARTSQSAYADALITNAPAHTK